MSGKSAAVRAFLEQMIPKAYRADVDTVTLQERGKANPTAALTPAEQAALQQGGAPPAAAVDPAAQAQPGAAPAGVPPAAADPAAQAQPGAPVSVDAPAREPGVFEQAQDSLGSDMFRDPMPGTPPDIPDPAGRELTHRTPERNINLDRVRTPDDIKALIDETAKVVGPEDTTTHAAISAKAGGVDVLNLLANGKPSDAWNPQQLLATRRLMVAEAERLHEMAVELAEQHGISPRSITPEKWAEFANMKNRYSALQKVVQGKTRIAAQTLNSLAITAGPTARAARLQEMDELVSRVGGSAELARQAQLLAGLDPADAKNAKSFGTAASKLSGVREVAFSVWINGLLSSPPTHFVNVLSNTATNVYESLIINPLGGLFGAARGAAFGATDRMYAGESIARFAGTVSGTIDGIVTGTSRALGPRGVQGIGKGSKVDVREYVVDTGNPVADYLADMALQGPSRFLDGEDQFFKVLGYRQELNVQAYRRAAKEGLRGDEFQKRIHQLVNDPDEQMHLAALEYAEEITYTNRPHDNTLFGSLAQAGSKVREMYPLATLVMPFVRTPANIADYAVKNIPGANTWQIVNDLRAGGAKADNAMARLTVSWTALWAVWEAVEDGRVTGTGPTNKRMWRAYEDAGYKPRSIRVGDQWHQYDRFDPMGLVVNVLADFAEAARHAKDPTNMTMAVGAAMMGLGENLADSSYLQSVGELLEVLRADDAKIAQGVKWMSRMAGSFMPYSAMSGYIARSEDTDEQGRAHVRSAPRPSMTGETPLWTSILQNMSTRSPLHREDLPMTIDWKGQPAMRDYGGYLDEAFPIKYAEVRKDKVASALWENRVAVLPPDPLLKWTFPLGREYLSPMGLPMPVTTNLLDLDNGRGEVLEEYQMRVGKARYNELQMALFTLGYDKLPADAKGSYTPTADALSAASAAGTITGTEDFALWYLSVSKDRGWPVPGSPEWDEIAAAQRPLVANEANPDAPVQPAPPGALRF